MTQRRGQSCLGRTAPAGWVYRGYPGWAGTGWVGGGYPDDGYQGGGYLACLAVP